MSLLWRSFYQIATLIPSVYNTNLPESIADVLESMSVVTGLSFNIGTSLECQVSIHVYVHMYWHVRMCMYMSCAWTCTVHDRAHVHVQRKYMHMMHTRCLVPRG